MTRTKGSVNTGNTWKDFWVDVAGMFEFVNSAQRWGMVKRKFQNYKLVHKIETQDCHDLLDMRQTRKKFEFNGNGITLKQYFNENGMNP